MVSADNLKSLWCIYLGSGLWRGWQILHKEFARCLLAASGFQAPWRERRTKPTAWVLRGRVRGALVWLLTCKWSEGPEAILPDSRAILPTTQRWLQAVPCEAPGILAAEVSPNQLCCKTSVWDGDCGLEISPGTCGGSGLFGCRSTEAQWSFLK